MQGLLRNHPRIWIGVALGIGVFFSLPTGWLLVTRVLAAWDCGVTLFLVLLWVWMSRLTAQQICSRYIEEDASGPVILVVVVIGALLSLVAIVQPLATLRHVEGSERMWHFVLAAVTLADSWLLVPAMFTTHYADLYYSCPKSERPLSFPDTDMPIFWDFAYFSFTIAAACQTADIFTRRSSVRRVVLMHEVISFLFNASILGFAINVTAGLIGG
jgi:uncharacterized membrane protein